MHSKKVAQLPKISKAMYDEEKIKQEKSSLKLIPDSFKKIIIEEEDIVPYHDNDGFVRMGLLDFLLRPDSLSF